MLQDTRTHTATTYIALDDREEVEKYKHKVAKLLLFQIVVHVEELRYHRPVWERGGERGGGREREGER